jgi:hypothetical protein
MSWFDKAKEWAGKQACNAGLHSYVWTYDFSGSCDQTGRCNRSGCDERASRVVHQHSDWIYESTDSCKLIKQCARCHDTIEGNVKHLWEDPVYTAPSECTRVRYCARNKEHLEPAQEKHKWSEPQYVREGSCEQLAVCQRNSEHRSRSESHIWGPPEPLAPDSCFMQQRCLRCPKGVKPFGQIHNDLPVGRTSDGKLQLRCSRCKRETTA